MSGVDEMSHEPEGDDLLAAEYVLGVLSSQDRESASLRIEQDQAFARLVDAWEVRLAPMSDAYDPVEPPARTKTAIDRRLFAPAAPPRSGHLRPAGYLGTLTFWRAMTLVATAALLLAVFLPRGVDRPSVLSEPLYAASLADQGAGVSYLAVYDAANRTLSLSHLAGQPEAERDFELWLVEGDAAPVSVGIVPAGQTARMPVPEQLATRVGEGIVLAISSEPLGGSPTGVATGPVVAAGDLRPI